MRLRDQLAEELGANEWFVPEEFGLADVAVGCMLGYLDLRLPEVDWRSRHANLVSFADRIFARESFAATLPRAQTITPLG